MAYGKMNAGKKPKATKAKKVLDLKWVRKKELMLRKLVLGINNEWNGRNS